ncbi:MAG: hypothetical protein J0H96_11980 [Microbacterium ginsengisoli]|jgi:hypothetical protein|nr:hypothetical protein [Microbacterium ginsengisoli]
MTLQDYFPAPTAYSPDTNLLVAGAQFKVYAVDDTAFTTALAVTSPTSGAAINPLESNSVGILPDFAVVGAPAQVLLKSGSFVTKLTSAYGAAILAVAAAGLDPEVVAAAAAAGETVPALVEQAQAAAESVAPGQPNGTATLDATSKVPAAQIPMAAIAASAELSAAFAPGGTAGTISKSTAQGVALVQALIFGA